MKKFILSAAIFLGVSAYGHAEKTKTIYSPFTGKLDYITKVTSTTLGTDAGLSPSECVQTDANGALESSGSPCGSSGGTLISSGVAFGSPTDTVTQDTNTFVWNRSLYRLTIGSGTSDAGDSVTGYGLRMYSPGTAGMAIPSDSYPIILTNPYNSSFRPFWARVWDGTAFNTGPYYQVDLSTFNPTVRFRAGITAVGPETDGQFMFTGAVPGSGGNNFGTLDVRGLLIIPATAGVSASSFTLTLSTASQFVKTDASRNLVSFDLFNDSSTYKGPSNWTSINASTFTNIHVNDEAFGPTWDGSTRVPTKNAEYDQFIAVGQSTQSLRNFIPVSLSTSVTGTLDISANTNLTASGNANKSGDDIGVAPIKIGSGTLNGNVFDVTSTSASVSGIFSVSSNTILSGATFYNTGPVLFGRTDSGTTFLDARNQNGSVNILFGSTTAATGFTSPYQNVVINNYLGFASDPGTKAINNFISLILSSGATTLSNMTARALNFTTQNNGTGTYGTMTGALGSVVNASNGSIITAVGYRGSYAQTGVGGTITTGKGFEAVAPTNNGTVTTGYGFYSNAQNVGSFTNTPYGFYQEGSSDFNYFNGKTGFNNTLPQTLVHVSSGSVQIDGSQTDSYSLRVSTAPNFYHVAVSTNGHLNTKGTSPVVSGCGTSPSIVGSDIAFTVTVGATTTGCTITFKVPYNATPTCTVTEQTVSVVNALSYTVTKTAVTLSQTALGGNILDVICLGRD